MAEGYRRTKGKRNGGKRGGGREEEGQRRIEAQSKADQGVGRTAARVLENILKREGGGGKEKLSYSKGELVLSTP